MIRFFMMSKRRITNFLKRRIIVKLTKKFADLSVKKDKTRMGEWGGDQISELKRWGQEQGIVIMRT